MPEASIEPEFCPRCGAVMLPSKEAFKIGGMYVGSYDSMTCPVCEFYYFTDKEYELALEDAKALGLVGPKLIRNTTLQELVIKKLSLSSSSSFLELEEIKPRKKILVENETQSLSINSGDLQSPSFPITVQTDSTLEIAS